MSRHSKRGLTLVEVVVAITVVIIVTVIAVQVMLRQREARRGYVDYRSGDRSIEAQARDTGEPRNRADTRHRRRNLAAGVAVALEGSD